MMTKDKLFTFHALHHFYGMIQIFIVLIVCNRFIFTLIIFVMAADHNKNFNKNFQGYDSFQIEIYSWRHQNG